MRLESQEQKARIRLPYNPTPWQRKVLKDDHRFKVVVAGARSGKTILALLKLILSASLKENSVNWYVAPTFGMAKTIAWGELKHMIDGFWEYNLIRKINDSELLVDLINNSSIQLKSSDSPDSLRGVGLDSLVLDEYASMRKEVWEEVLRPRVIDRKGEALFIGTPQGYGHFYDLYKMEFKEPDFWKSFHFKTIDNPHIDKKEIKQAKKDMDPKAFKQEFEASFETFGGQVFPSFSRDEFVKDFKFQKDHWEFYLGMDFGWSSPTAALFIQVNPADDNVYIFDEIGVTETTIHEMAKLIRAKNYRHWSYQALFSREYGPEPTADPDKIFCDPAGDARSEALGTSSARELRELGFHVSYKNNRPGIIAEGLGIIRKWMLNKKLWIHPRCINLTQAFEMYRYPEPKHGIQSEAPLKDGISDHWIDALRYFFLNRFPVRRAVVTVL